MRFCLILRQLNKLVLYSQNRGVYSAPHWKRGRAVEGTGLENRRPERVLEFESLRFRQILNKINSLKNGFDFIVHKVVQKSPFIRAFFTSKVRPFSLKILSDTHRSGEG